MTVEEEVDNAVRAAALSPDVARKCNPAEASAIVSQAMAKFVKGDPLWWWNSRAEGPWEFHPYDTHDFEHLPKHVPAGQTRCWFIPETESAKEPLPVYDCTIDAVVAIVKDCSFSEYYVVGKRMDWIAINTHHGQFVVWKRALGVLVDISTVDAASEPDPMCWNGNIDVLVGETLLRIGPSRGSLLVLPSLEVLADAVVRLRGVERSVEMTFAGDTSSLRMTRQDPDEAHVATVSYRGEQSLEVEVTKIDEACRDAVLQFFKSLSPEQRLALRSEDAMRTLAAVTSVWPELGQVT
jgi:hypothetical protein